MTPFELGFITALRCIELLQDSLRAEAEDIMKPDETIVAEHAIVFMDSRGRLTWINKKVERYENDERTSCKNR